jgi:hypothetical protein
MRPKHQAWSGAVMQISLWCQTSASAWRIAELWPIPNRYLRGGGSTCAQRNSFAHPPLD